MWIAKGNTISIHLHQILSGTAAPTPRNTPASTHSTTRSSPPKSEPVFLSAHVKRRNKPKQLTTPASPKENISSSDDEEDDVEGEEIVFKSPSPDQTTKSPTKPMLESKSPMVRERSALPTKKNHTLGAKSTYTFGEVDDESPSKVETKTYPYKSKLKVEEDTEHEFKAVQLAKRPVEHTANYCEVISFLI